MKVVILYRPNSEHGRVVEEYIHDYRSRHVEDTLEAISIDTRDGSSMAALYDVMQYPAIMVLRTDGYVNKLWQGEGLPLMDEVAAYLRA